MKWQCGICKAEQDAKFVCTARPQCKNGMFVKELKPKMVVYDHAANAVNWGYEVDKSGTVRSSYAAKDGHKPQSTVYLHHSNVWAISPDISTHGGSNPAQTPYWKVFRDQGGWRYWGSFNGLLQQVDRGQGTGREAPPTT